MTGAALRNAQQPPGHEHAVAEQVMVLPLQWQPQLWLPHSGSGPLHALLTAQRIVPGPLARVVLAQASTPEHTMVHEAASHVSGPQLLPAAQVI